MKLRRLHCPWPGPWGSGGGLPWSLYRVDGELLPTDEISDTEPVAPVPTDEISNTEPVAPVVGNRMAYSVSSTERENCASYFRDGTLGYATSAITPSGGPIASRARRQPPPGTSKLEQDRAPALLSTASGTPGRRPDSGSWPNSTRGQYPQGVKVTKKQMDANRAGPRCVPWGMELQNVTLMKLITSYRDHCPSKARRVYR